jgi:hypothetical protein
MVFLLCSLFSVLCSLFSLSLSLSLSCVYTQPNERTCVVWNQTRIGARAIAAATAEGEEQVTRAKTAPVEELQSTMRLGGVDDSALDHGRVRTKQRKVTGR